MLKRISVIFLSLLHLGFYCSGAQSYADTVSSVLSSGKWTKARVSESGLYRLSSKTLSAWGYSDISKVAVYSNGGAELPYLNSAERINDLNRLPVYRTANELVFYVEGTQKWTYNTSSQQYQCANNECDEYTYVFITDATSPSEPLQLLTLPDVVPTNDISYNSTLLCHELHKINIDKTGRDWYGETLTKQNPKLKIDFGSLQRVPSARIILKLKLASATKDRMEYSVSYNDSVVSSTTVRAYQSSNEVGVSSQVTKSFTHTGNLSDNTVTLQCVIPQATDAVYLDNIAIEIPTKLQMPKSGALLLNIAEGTRVSRRSYSRVTVSGVSSESQVWCVDTPTSPSLVKTIAGNGTLSFNQENTNVHKYIAFELSKVSSLAEPKFVSNVDNQNLHATPPVDYLIVYHPDFKSQAEELADFHRLHSGMSVATADVNMIYNEFGGGQRGPIAIRDYVRYVYNSSKGQLKYLLLFGSGSYDNLTYGNDNPYNLIPTYQSAQTLNTTQTYCTDDFFGWLDDAELTSDTRATLEIGIGRFPVLTPAAAQTMVDRVRNYTLNAPHGAWTNRIVQFSCEGDDNEHSIYANENADYIESLDESVDVSRVYSEAFPSVQSTTGRVFPQAIDAFYNDVNNKGAFLVNYVGHGGFSAAGKYIEINAMSRFSNKERLPFMIGATCDFAPFDRATSYVSKELLTYPYGGFIAVLSTTRLVYGNNSHSLNMAMLQGLLTEDENGGHRRLGDALKFAKRKASSMINSLKYVLLGDPALLLVNNADYSVATDSVCGELYESAITPIRALATNYVSGSVRDEMGNVVDSFNGSVEVSLYDKRRERATLGAVSGIFKYSEWGSRLFHSTYPVKNGRFSMPIQLTKDIDATEGYGRLSYVAWSEDDRHKATGGSNMVLVGGFADEIQNDTIGPDLHLYVDYPSWQNGGLTSSSPLFYAQMSDASGINSSGVGVGHSITMTVDNDPNSTIVLNNYYSLLSTAPETGRLQYQLSNLSPGLHTVSLKVWDNMGNSTQRSISLRVSSESQIEFDNIQLFPSAYSSKSEPLTLRFFHNNASAGNNLNVSIFNLSGQLVSSIQTSLQTGTSDSGIINLSDIMPAVSSLANGIYVINVKVIGSNGRRGEFTRKFAF